MAAKDYTIPGAVFSRLTVTSAPFKDGRRAGWQVRCRCECGTEKDIICQLLVSGHTRSCGCMHRESVAKIKTPDEHPPIGSIFGRLTVISEAFRHGSEGRWHVTCRCACGIEKPIMCKRIRGGATESCGCIRKGLINLRNRKHGHSGGATRPSGTYLSWVAAKSRCYDQKDSDYANYGGRGISMCDRWRDDFSSFLADMGERPSGASLDRFPDVDGNYEPSNCRWATSTEQANNRRNNVLIDYKGEMKTCAQVAREIGMRASVLANRIRSGWSVERATTEPVIGK